MFNNLKEKKIIFIDFEYTGYNYISYDIANFMNESTIDYQCTEYPFFKFIKENIFTK